MPFKTDFNVAPYFDDYNELKNYHRIMFRPSVAVQARELTQSQTILQNQIERFGNWAFKSGDIVEGCIITDIPVLPYVRLADFASNGSANSVALNVVDLINTVATSVTSNLKAQVLFANAGFSTSYPDNNILYLKYLNTGTGGEALYSNSDLLTFEQVTTSGNVAIANVYTFANTTPGQNTTGNSHGISVSDGIIFINGAFVRVSNSTFGLVNNFGTYAGNNVVAFDLNETIVTENQDTSLLDNALGYTNENAPGAHRLKCVPTLISIDPSEITGNNTINPIAIYNFGALVKKDTQNKLYSTIGDIVATRTYEESGNYVVNPFAVDTISLPPTGGAISFNSNNVFGRINPGSGYAQGYRVNLDATTYINMRRGIDTKTNLTQQITFNYGGYFILNEVAGSFDFTKAQTVTLYDTPQQAVTTRTYCNVSPTGNAIGTASVRCFNYAGGVLGLADTSYSLHVFNIKLNTGYNINQIKSVYYGTGTKAVGDVVSNGIVGSASKEQLYSFGLGGIKTVEYTSTNYVYRKLITGQSMNTSGVISVTLPTSAQGGIDELPYSASLVPLTDLQASNFMLICAADVDSSNNPAGGTASISSTSTTVTGSSTTFTTKFFPGDNIKVGANYRKVVSVSNNTVMTVDAVWPSSLSGQTYKKSYIKGQILPITQYGDNVTSTILINDSTTFTINSGQIPSTTLSVDVILNVLRTQVKPATKDIYKDRFVKIKVANSVGGPNGPWCLGVGDVHKISKIYSSTDGSFSTSNIDATADFILDTGQKDTHYDYGYIYSRYGSLDPNTCLLVQMDYFNANTQQGIGFFTVDSYPVDDANTANTNAIQTKDIPLYVDEAGTKRYLRDYIDYRTPANNTANNTGTCNTANVTQLTAALSYATVNPSATLTFKYDSTYGLDVPSYGENFEANYTYYLPRKDLIYITADNKVKVKEGLSSANPQKPLYPENAMAVAVLNVPPYPSLSSDETDGMRALNASAKNLIRDTNTAISSTIVTNRRYTMRDVGKLDQRITNLEYYTQLSLLEKKATDLTVTDANGLDRFKNGIFVDPFSNFSLSDVSNPEFNIAIDAQKGVARPAIVREVVKIKFNDGSTTAVTNSSGTFYVDYVNNVQKTGRSITLPYDEISFLRQPYATKYRSSALVAFAWNGTVILIPSYDNHGDTINTGSMNIVIDNATPWRDFAQSPFGQTWGDWRTSVSSVSNSVIHQVTRDVNLGYVAGGTNAGAVAANIWTYLGQAGYNPTDFTIGNQNIQWTGSDIRLKREIRFLKKLVNGINLYIFKYIWSDILYVGVMAQEVQRVIPEAVRANQNGLLSVSYPAIGIKFETYEDWKTNNSMI
jgi:hypothetical protein